MLDDRIRKISIEESRHREMFIDEGNIWIRSFIDRAREKRDYTRKSKRKIGKNYIKKEKHKLKIIRLILLYKKLCKYDILFDN